MSSTRNKLINILSSSKDKYTSGESLSEKLNVTRSAIWKHMKELEKDGYIIEGKSKVGYRILDYPNKLSENTLQWGLDTKWIGTNIVHKEVTTSTQLIAHELAQAGEAPGTIVIADEQTAGRGRLNRAWHSTKEKGIWLSIILRPNLLPYLAPQLTLLTATVLAEVIKEYTSIKPQIKWPNDILINNKKVAGILTEMQAEQDTIQYVIIGIGINVNQTKEDLPKDMQYKATSLKLETNKQINLTDFTQKILRKYEEIYTNYLNKGFPYIKEKWETYGFKIGQQIRMKTTKDTWKTTFSGIAEDGALLAKNKEGKTEKIYSAEIDWFEEGDI